MPRITPVFKPSDYPGTPDVDTQKELTALFAHMFPGNPNPQFDTAHLGWAVMAHNPQLTRRMYEVTRYVVAEMPWARRQDLLELSIQALNLHYKCASSFQAHLTRAASHGISVEMQAAIPYWRTTDLFNDEQRLVIEFTLAAVTGDVPEIVYQRVVQTYGEKQTLEFTVAVAHFAFWAILLNVASPDTRTNHPSAETPR